MCKCIIDTFDEKGKIQTLNLRKNIESLKSDFRRKNGTDDILKKGLRDKSYERYCMQLDDSLDKCKCDEIPLKCEKCSEEDHDGFNNYFCRCEDRNIKLAKQLRSNKSSWSCCK